MSIVDTRVFCDACGERLCGMFEEFRHKSQCRGYSRRQVEAMTEEDISVLVGLYFMVEAIRVRYRNP